MNLSVFELAYLGSPSKDTAHLGKSHILRYANSQFVTASTDNLWLDLLGFRPQPDWPLAKLLWLQEIAKFRTLPSPLNPHGSLMLAQPVHLTLQRDSFALDSVVTLSSEEYQSITQALNVHFNEEGIQFIPSNTYQYWFLQTTTPWQVSTHALQSVLHQNIQSFMPQGPNASQLRQIANQVQMLLHEHPINLHRQQQRALEINSIWLSGHSLAEQMPLLPHNTKMALIGENAMTQAISSTFSVTCFADLALAKAAGVQHAVMLLEEADSASWDSIYKAVQARKVHRLNAYCPAVNGTLQLSLKPLDCWKFWRKPVTFIERIMSHV